jgi:N6-adenosine-specific RNA methylase IME4
MKIEEICALPVRSVVADNAHLYLWTTNNYLRRAFEVVDAWGFQYVTTTTWRKLGRAGLGQYFRGTTEHVLFCRRGCPPYRVKDDGKRAQGLTDFEAGAWFEAERDVHSRKPPNIHEWAEIISPGPYLEMFARTARVGWEAWGNQAPEEPLTLEDLL